MNEALKPFKVGLKRLFYSKSLEDSYKISFIKISLFISFILCICFSFIQFSIVSVSDIVVLDPLTELETQRFALKTNHYGFIAHILGFFLLIGIFFYLGAGDKPFNEQYVNLMKLERKYLVIGLFVLFISLLFGIALLIGKFTFDNTGTLVSQFSYRIGIIIFYIWLLILPALSLNGSFFIVDIITYDYPRTLYGFSKKNLILLLCELVITSVIIFLTFLIFGVTLESRPNVQDIQPFQIITESIGFFRINFYWMLVNINLLVIVVLIIFIMFLLIDKMGLIHSKKFNLSALGVFIIFSMIMPFIVVLLSLPTNIVLSQIAIPIDLVIFLFIFFLIFLMVAINKKLITEPYIKNREGLLPWLILFCLLFILLKTIPSAIIFYSPELKSLRSIFDIISLLIVLFVSSLRVIMVPEIKNKNTLDNKQKLSYFKWFSHIPTYVKVLFLLYISYNAFYISLESYSIAVLLRSSDYITNLKLEFLTATTFIGAFYAFWVYMPHKTASSTPGLLKTLELQVKKVLDKNKV